MQGFLPARASWPALMAASRGAISNLTSRKRDMVVTLAAKAGDRDGDVGQARRRDAPAAGRRGGGGRRDERPSAAVRQAFQDTGELLATALVMAWPLLAIGLAVADPPPGGVFAYLADPREMSAAMVRD